MNETKLPSWATNSMAGALLHNDMCSERYALGDKSGTFEDPNTQAAFEAWLARDAWGEFKRKIEEERGKKNGENEKVHAG